MYSLDPAYAAVGGAESLETQHAQLEALDAAALGADIKRRRANEAVRGAAVAHQRSIWDRILEVRILLQRALTSSHSLPPDQGRAAAAAQVREMWSLHALCWFAGAAAMDSTNNSLMLACMCNMLIPDVDL